MDRISPHELSEWQSARRTFTLLDVRRGTVRVSDGAEVPGARWLNPEHVLAWKDEIPRDRPTVLYCAKGHEIGQGIAATLRALGLDARYLVDGFEGWRAAQMPVNRLTATEGEPYEMDHARASEN